MVEEKQGGLVSRIMCMLQNTMPKEKLLDGQRLDVKEVEDKALKLGAEDEEKPAYDINYGLLKNPYYLLWAIKLLYKERRASKVTLEEISHKLDQLERLKKLDKLDTWDGYMKYLERIDEMNGKLDAMSAKLSSVDLNAPKETLIATVKEVKETIDESRKIGEEVTSDILDNAPSQKDIFAIITKLCAERGEAKMEDINALVTWTGLPKEDSGYDRKKYQYVHTNLRRLVSKGLVTKVENAETKDILYKVA